MNKQITICGIGPGHKSFVLPAVLDAVANCDVLIGGSRHIREFALPGQHTVTFNGHEAELREAIQNFSSKRITLLVSGDTGFHSALRTFKRIFPHRSAKVIPGISTYQYFFSQLQLSYEDAFIGSMHASTLPLIYRVQHHKYCFMLTDRQRSWNHIAQQLCDSGLGHCTLFVGNRLSYPDQCIVSGAASELVHHDYNFDLCAVIVHNPAFNPVHECSYGLPDTAFMRDKVPMTKEEVRSVVLSKLTLRSHDHLLDVGAGTGSVTIEAARLLTNGHVTALEHKEEAIALIRKNAEKHKVYNYSLLQGRAAELLAQCKQITRVFIGGSGGELPEIIRWTAQNTPSQTVVVVTAVSLDTLEECRRLFNTAEFSEPEIVQIAVTRVTKTGNSDMLKAQSPVWIIRTTRN